MLQNPNDEDFVDFKLEKRCYDVLFKFFKEKLEKILDITTCSLLKTAESLNFYVLYLKKFMSL